MTLFGRQTGFQLLIFAEVDGSISNLNQFSAPVAADFTSIIGEEYTALAIEVSSTEVILKEQDLQIVTFETPPSVNQLTEIGTALVEMFVEMAEAESGKN